MQAAHRPTRSRKAKRYEGLRAGRVRLGQPEGLPRKPAEHRESWGCVVGLYRTLGGHQTLLSICRLKIEPTPFFSVILDVTTNGWPRLLADGRFLDLSSLSSHPKGVLDPTAPSPRGHAPLGAKSITALVVAEREVAWQILALTRKAHNLRTFTGVIRIYRGWSTKMARDPNPAFASISIRRTCHSGGVLRTSRALRGGAYHPILRRLETFSDEPLHSFLGYESGLCRAGTGGKGLTRGKKLKERGLVSPIPALVCRGPRNPLRWIRGSPPLEDVLKTMRERVAKFNVERSGLRILRAAGRRRRHHIGEKAR